MFLLKSQAKIDEFGIILLAAIILIGILAFVWGTPPTSLPGPEVKPTSKSLTIASGSTSIFDFEIIGTLTNVTLTATGEISSWISFNKNNFDVVNSTTVKVTIKVPSWVGFNTYTGNIVVNSAEGEKIVPITISVEEVVGLVSHAFPPLGDFSISYRESSEVLDSKEDFKVSKGYFSENSASLHGLVDKTELPFVTETFLYITIEETNSIGNLIVFLNDQKIFDKKVGSGLEVIPINVSLIGESNIIIIKAGSPGWRFWTSTDYKIKLAEFTVDFKGSVPKAFNFSLEQVEVDNFDYLHLIFRREDSSRPLPELMIKVNSQIIFWSKPPLLLFNDTFRKDMWGNPLFLTVGDNTISFSIEERGFYDIADALLVLYYRG